MKKNMIVILALIFGFITLIFAYAIDTFLPILADEIGGLKWILVGIAAGIIGYSSSNLLTSKMYKKDPEIAKQAKINENDERFVTIRKTATYYTWFITLFSLMGMVLIFTILNLSTAVWFALAALFLHIVSAFVLVIKLNKKM